MTVSMQINCQELPNLHAESTIPYNISGFSMMIVMPNEVDGLNHIKKNIELLNFNCENRRSKEKTILYLPKFTIESTFNLNDSLKDLDMTTLYENIANFKDIRFKTIKS